MGAKNKTIKKNIKLEKQSPLGFKDMEIGHSYLIKNFPLENSNKVIEISVIDKSQKAIKIKYNDDVTEWVELTSTCTFIEDLGDNGYVTIRRVTDIKVGSSGEWAPNKTNITNPNIGAIWVGPWEGEYPTATSGQASSSSKDVDSSGWNLYNCISSCLKDSGLFV